MHFMDYGISLASTGCCAVSTLVFARLDRVFALLLQPISIFTKLYPSVYVYKIKKR